MNFASHRDWRRDIAGTRGPLLVFGRILEVVRLMPRQLYRSTVIELVALRSYSASCPV